MCQLDLAKSLTMAILSGLLATLLVRFGVIRRISPD
jgi:hypothetical protein